MKKALIYTAATLGISWVVALVYHLTTGFTGPEMGLEALADFQKFATIYMFLPAIVAFILQAIGGELTIRRPHSARIKIVPRDNSLLRFRPRWSWLVAIATVPAMVALSILFSGLFSDVVPMKEGMVALVQAQGMGALPEEAMAELNAVPGWVMMLTSIVSALLAGITINALFAFGEEYGWRFYMVDALRGKKFIVAALVIGAVWGIWHAPLILMGHNYPDGRIAGIFMMVLFCILGGIVELYFVVKSGTFWPAIFIHGTINALAGLGVILIPGGSRFLTGMTGIAGFMAIAVVIALLYLYDRYISHERIFHSTLGSSLSRHEE